jgi:UDP-3-O-[3-hydroxymyristoyl] glucosamine N-acyltransferase
MKLDDLARQIEAQVVGDGSVDVTGVAPLETAGARQIGFVSNPKYLKHLESTRAGAVIVGENVQSNHVALLKTQDPYYALMRTVVLLHGHRKHPHAGIHDSAHVDGTAQIGAGTVVYPNAFIGPGCRVGRDCVIYPGATIYDGCRIGDRVIIHAGAVIGTDGFGFATHGGVHHKIPQIGSVVLEDDVEIGANAVIARGSLSDTRIGRGTKIDALVIVAHGSTIGEHGLLVAQVGIAGSTQIGDHVTLAGQVGIAGHLKIGNHVTVGAQGGVMEDVPDKQVLIGSPAMPARHARRVYTIFAKLPELLDRIKELEERTLSLEGRGKGEG